jgi:hypothetical protein
MPHFPPRTHHWEDHVNALLNGRPGATGQPRKLFRSIPGALSSLPKINPGKPKEVAGTVSTGFQGTPLARDSMFPAITFLQELIEKVISHTISRVKCSGWKSSSNRATAKVRYRKPTSARCLLEKRVLKIVSVPLSELSFLPSSFPFQVP